MEEENNNFFVSKISKKKKKKFLRIKNGKLFKKNFNKKSYKFLLIFLSLLLMIIIFPIIIIFLNNLKLDSASRNKNHIKLDLEKMHDVYNYSLEYDEFDEDINSQYIKFQNYFCEKEDKNLNENYEKK